MASIRVAIDNIRGKSSDAKTLETFAQKLREAGHTVTTHGVGPNRIQQTMLKSSNKCDVMIQVAGGKCLGTLVDFYKGLNSYYHASAGGFAYFQCYSPDWKAVRAHDDRFSSEASLAPYKGKTLPVIYDMMKKNKKMAFGYGNTAEECAKTFLESYTGKSVATGTTGAANTTGGGGGSLLEIIKEICSDWNPYGPEMTLTGNTVNIKRTNPKTAINLNETMIINNSVSFNDYDISTPNVYKKTEDKYLINKFGKIPLDESTVDSPQEEQVLLMAQRNHEHSIDMKVVLDPRLTMGKWVNLSLKRYGIENRKYIITKANYQEERTMNITLEPGPPELYVEVQEVPETTEESTEEESTEDT